MRLGHETIRAAIVRLDSSRWTMSPALLEAVTVWILERFSDGARSPA